MKAMFKPLGLAAAVAAVSAGYTGAASATVANNALGDFAIVPYYTVQGGWVTGVHIINTSSQTQVVKFRMRRAKDSVDILDFNLIMSPEDEWTGTIRGDDTAMEVVTTDKSCTAPLKLKTNGVAPVTILEGAQEGYIEIIGMGSASVTSPIGRASEHVAAAGNEPLDCLAVETNFFAAAQTINGANQVTVQTSKTTNPQLIPLLNGPTTYSTPNNALKVSYFIRDNDSGIEFGNNAVHIQDFTSIPLMSHQQFGLESYSQQGSAALDGWDFPDTTGGGASTGYDTAFQDVIRPDLGAAVVLNDWSYNAETGAATDWVITFPGQYAMIDRYAQALYAAGDPTATYNFQEIPVVATFAVRDREETAGIPGGLDFSPAPAPDSTLLPNEVNVITWGPATIPPVLNSAAEYTVRVNPSQAGITSPTGWAKLAVKGTTKRANVAVGVGGPVPFSVCPNSRGVAGGCTPVSGPVPMVGFTAWQRTFDNPDKNYGRIIEHSFIVNSAD